MLHDLIVFLLLGVVAGIGSLMLFALSRPGKFRNKMEWWKVEGIIAFALIWIVLLILAVSAHLFHSLR